MQHPRWLRPVASGLGFLAAFAIGPPVSAQSYRDAGGTNIQGMAPLIGCSPQGSCLGPVSSSNPLPVVGTFASPTGGFAPSASYSPPLAVSTTSTRSALPAGSVVVVYNTGSNSAYVQLGGAGVTASTADDVISPGGWLAFTVGSNTYIAAITVSGASTLNLSGGSGSPAGASGGATGGAVSFPTGAAGSPNPGVLTVQGVSGGLALPVSGTFWQTTQPVSLSSLPTLSSGANTIGAVQFAGTVGTDFSANKPTVPVVGAGFASTGSYANYLLVATVAASSARNNIDIENISGGQIAVLRDDGTAAAGAAPNNASVFALSGGALAGAQGGSWTSQTFKGRVQIYAPSSTAQIAVFVD